jgi:4-amino-4-deoxy-L-arabinose transferase-like glycosyltransferase
MQTTWTRIGWALASVLAVIGVVAWPIAAGAGPTLAVSAYLAGLRAAAIVLLLIALALAAVDAHLDAERRHGDSPPSSKQER